MRPRVNERPLESYKRIKNVRDLLESSKFQKQKPKRRDQESEGHMHVNVRCLSEVEFKS